MMNTLARAALGLTLACALVTTGVPAFAQPQGDPTATTNDSSKDPEVEATSTDIDNASGYTPESANESSEVKNFSADKIGDDETQAWFNDQHEWVQRALIVAAINGTITLIAVLFLGPIRGIVYQLFGV